MNIRLRHSFNFLAGVCHSAGQIDFNEYDLTLDLITNTVDSIEQNIAFDRIAHYVDNIVTNGIFIEAKSPEVATLHNAGFRVITLPEVPYDQIVGLALYTKLTAIMEERMFITDTEIASRLGKGVPYLHAAEESTGPFELPGWWNDPGITYFDKKLSLANNKVVKLVKKKESWRDYNLDWAAGTELAGDTADQTESNVVIVKFDDSDDNQ